MLKPVPDMRSSFLLFIVLLLAACSDDHNNTCSTADPAQELPWLKTLIEKSRTDNDDIIVEQGKYHLKQFSSFRKDAWYHSVWPLSISPFIAAKAKD